MPVRFRSLWERFIKPSVDLATLAVSLVGLSSIWIAIHEMRVNEETSSISAYQSIETLSLELDKMLVEHPTLVPYFLYGKKIDTTSSDYNQVVALADVRIGAMDAIISYAEFKHIGTSIGGWKRTFSRYFLNSPIMCERLKSNKDDYVLIVPLGEANCNATRK